MPPRSSEALAQKTFLLHLRYAIDNARRFPFRRNEDEAVALARSQPMALRSSHVRHNLGASRWDWLAARGVYPVGEGGEIEGSVKGTITPDIIKEVNH